MLNRVRVRGFVALVMLLPTLTAVTLAQQRRTVTVKELFALKHQLEIDVETEVSGPIRTSIGSGFPEAPGRASGGPMTDPRRCSTSPVSFREHSGVPTVFPGAGCES